MSGDQLPDFATVLDGALSQRPFTLDAIARKLTGRGLKVSQATLSYWRTGRSLPQRRQSLQIVRALEEILGTEPGQLVSALAPGEQGRWLPAHAIPGTLDMAGLQAAGLDLDRRVEVLSAHHALVHHADGSTTVTTSEVVRSQEDGLRSLTVVLAVVPGLAGPPQVRPVLGCECEAVVGVAHGDREAPTVWAVDMRLPRQLAVGDCAATEFEVRWPGTITPRGLLVPCPGAAGLFTMQVVRQDDDTGRVEYRHVPRAGDQASDVRDLGHDRAVQLTLESAAPGLHRLDWPQDD